MDHHEGGAILANARYTGRHAEPQRTDGDPADDQGGSGSRKRNIGFARVDWHP
jgi:hypothetical protein